jgi:hypothetical protein
LTYIHAKLKISISDSYIDRTKRIVKKSLIQKLHRIAYIEQFFRRIAEIEKLQKEAWAVYHANKNKPYMQMDCLRELHQLTIALGNLYEILPAFTGQYLLTREWLQKKREIMMNPTKEDTQPQANRQTQHPVDNYSSQNYSCNWYGIEVT